MSPNRRKKVEERIAELNTAIGSLHEVAGKLRGARPFVTPLVEEARNAGLKLVETRLGFLQILKECLEKGEMWTEKDEERKKQQEEEMNGAEKEWQRLFR